MDIVVGTAGHIDHGKTSLIKALTGVDADRLPEEKQRGITIDLGFAELDLGDVRIGFVDVPGHEKFVKNMLAGASGIDLVILVIAADEGVMPQTREHFEICRLLNIRAGLVALSKCDLVDDETLELAKMDAAELVEGSFLQGAPVIPISSRTGLGIPELRTALENAAASITKHDDVHLTRLPIDRSFTVKGFGAVVTGTLVSGAISEGDELEIMPDFWKVRVRGLQTHGKKVESAHAGQRTAVNLAGVDHAEIRRGMVLSERGVLRPTQILDAEIEVLHTAKNGLRSRSRVRVHIGTVEALARVSVLNADAVIAPGETDLVQLRLEVPIVAVPGERLIIRSYSPQITIAGGRVIDALAEKHRRKDIESVRTRLLKLSAAEADYGEKIRIMIEAAGQRGTTADDLQASTGLRRPVLNEAISANVRDQLVVAAVDQYISADAFNVLSAGVFEALADFHKRQPLARGIGLDALRERACRHASIDVFRSVLAALAAAAKIVIDNDIVRQAMHRTEFSPDEKQASDRLREIYASAGFDVPRLDEALSDAAIGTRLTALQVRTIFQIFLDSGEIVKVTDEFYFLRASIEKLIGMLKKYAAESPDRTIDVSRFKEIAGVSRKYAIPLLEYFDRERITQRAGDKRIIL